MKKLSKIITGLIITTSSFYFLFPFGNIYAGVVAPEKIKSVGFMKLNEQELLKLGITIKASQVEYIENKSFQNEDGTITDLSRKIVISRNLISGKNYKPKQQEKLSNVFPRFAVNVFNSGTAAYFSKLQDYSANADSSGKNEPGNAKVNNYAKANNLICVYFEFEPDKNKQNEKNQIYLWYEPTDALLKLLPKFYVEKLMEEVNSADKPETETERMIPVSTFNPDNAIISSLLYPNPSPNKFTSLNYVLSISRTVTIALYDIKGNKIKEIASSQFASKGEHNVNIPLENLDEGMYLVMLITDKQDKAIMKLIVVNN